MATLSKKKNRKTWNEKMLDGREPEVKKTNKDFADIPAGSTMLIPTPEIVADYISKIPKGKTADIRQIRNDLAAKFDAQYTCPVTTGIFLRIVAEAAYENYEKGTAISKITPFWRVIDENSSTAKKVSFPYAFISELRRKEGIPSGKTSHK